MSNNPNYIKKAQAFVKEFEKTRDAEFLGDACIELKKVNLKKEINAVSIMQVRTATLLQWLSLVQLLDDSKDPTFDAGKGVALKVPPKNTGAASWEGPTEAEVAANNKKIQNYNLQVAFQRMEKQIPPSAKTFIRKNYTGLPIDQAELRSSIEKVLKVQARKDDFFKLLVPLPPLPH